MKSLLKLVLLFAFVFVGTSVMAQSTAKTAKAKTLLKKEYKTTAKRKKAVQETYPEFHKTKQVPLTEAQKAIVLKNKAIKAKALKSKN